MRIVPWFVIVLAFTACATGGIKEKPAPMPDSLPDAADLTVEWWHVLEKGYSPIIFGQLYPTVLGEKIYVPLASGRVFEINGLGKITNEVQISDSLTAPLVIDSQQMVAITGEGRVVLLDLSYQKKWSINLNALSTEPALVTPERIFVQTIDGRINAIERITGRLLWVYQDAQPDLTLTGTSSPVLISTGSGSAIVTGLANGKVVALDVVDGSVVWEYRIARASGKTDVSRLVDVDAQVTVLGDYLIATGYQGDLVVIETSTGRVLQASAFSSYRSVQTNGKLLFGVDEKSHLVALNPQTLAEVWRATEFEYRRLSEILIQGEFLYVADAQGFLHALNAETGEWLTSRHIDFRGSNSNPIGFGEGVLMQGYSTRIKYLHLNIN